MLKGLGLHAEQLQVWALRASEGNLLEDNSKAIGDEVSMLWVTAASICRGLQAAAGQPLQLPADLHAAGHHSCNLAGGWGSSPGMTLLAVASEHQGSIQPMTVVADSVGAAK